MNSILIGRKKRPAQLAAARRSSQTKLGETLRQIRRKIAASGADLLDWDQLDREIAERRGAKNGEART